MLDFLFKNASGLDKNEKRDIKKFGKDGSKSGAVLGDILGKVFSSKSTKKKKS